jgi:hypothetical protein
MIPSPASQAWPTRSPITHVPRHDLLTFALLCFALLGRSTGVFPQILTKNSAGTTIDAATRSYNAGKRPLGSTITPANFRSPAPTVTLSSYTAGASSVTLTLTLTSSLVLPSTGKIFLRLPKDFAISTGSLTAAISSGLSGSVTAVGAGGRNVTWTRSGGSSVAAGTTIAVQVGGVFGSRTEPWTACRCWDAHDHTSTAGKAGSCRSRS